MYWKEVITINIIYAATVFMQGQILHASLALVAGLILVAFAIMLVARNYKSVKQGFPLQDERSRKVMVLALARAYLLSIYLLLAIGWASDDWIKFRDVSQATSLGILGMAVIFGLCWLYYNRKPSID